MVRHLHRVGGLIVLFSLAPIAQATAVYRPIDEYPPVCEGCGYFPLAPVFFPGPNLSIRLDLLLEGVSSIAHFQPPSTMDDVATFDPQVVGHVQVPPPVSFFDVFFLVDPVIVRVRDRYTAPTGVFQTEMLQLNLTGNSPIGVIQLRESPVLPSLGQVAISPDLGQGHRFDSFFDVFFELSLDGGSSWIPADSPMSLTLTNPEPSTLLLVVTGLAMAGLARYAKRR